jgi:hypothetical protein
MKAVTVEWAALVAVATVSSVLDSVERTDSVAAAGVVAVTDPPPPTIPTRVPAALVVMGLS